MKKYRRVNGGNGCAFDPTEEQVAIWDEFVKGTENLIVNACAGTGKTATMVEAFKQDKTASIVGKKRGMAAFNKSVGDELKLKVPKDVKAGTIHSLMLRELGQAVPGMAVNLNKLRDILNAEFDGRRWRRGERARLCRLVSLAKNHGFMPGERADDFLEEIQDHHGMFPDPGMRGRALMMLGMCMDVDLIRKYGVDFDDMVWLPYVWKLEPSRKYDLLVVDEVQDTNAIQQHNVMSLADRIVGVGDRNQAIYGFRGADTEAIDRLKRSLRGGCGELPLTVCWRCPSEVIAMAQRIVPHIRPREGAPAGEVTELMGSEGLWEYVSPGDMVLCRTNAPLVTLLFSLWKKNVRAYVQGRRIGQDLMEIVESEEEGCGDSTAQLEGKLLAREAREEERLMKRQDSATALLALRDKYECLYAMIANAEGSVKTLKDKLGYIFSDVDDREKVRLSSVHRAKGLEADTVYVIEPSLIPHGMAEQAWEVEQEHNLAYVAVTRAMKRLVFAGPIPEILC